MLTTLCILSVIYYFTALRKPISPVQSSDIP